MAGSRISLSTDGGALNASRLEAGNTAWRYAVGCAVILLVWIGVNAHWLSADGRLPVWDASAHATKTLDLALALGGGSEWTVREVLAHHRYPPFVYLMCAPAAWVAGHADAMILWMNFLFGFILVVSLYGIGKRLSISWAVPGGTLLMLCHPLTLLESRVFMLAFPLAAMVTCAYWRVLEAEYRWTPRNGLILGAVLGLGMLTKWAFALYAAPAVLWLAYRRLRTGMRGGDWRVAIVLVCATLLISATWYHEHWAEALGYLRYSFWESRVIELAPPGWSIAAWLEYTGHRLSVVPMAAWLFAVGVIFVSGARTARQLLYWFLAGYVLLVSIPTYRHVRYVMPLLPLMSLVTWWGLGQLRPRYVRRVVMASLAIWCLAQVAVQSVHWVDRRLPESLPRSASLFGRIHYSSGPALPMPDETAVGPLIDRFVAHTTATGKSPHVLLITNDWYHRPGPLHYELARRKVRQYPMFHQSDVISGRETPAMWQMTYEYVVYRDPPGEHNSDVIREKIWEFGRRFQQAPEPYRLVDRWTVDRGEAVVELYARPDEAS